MEEGSFRCDANISIRPEGSDRAHGQGRSQEHEQLPGRLPGPGVRGETPAQGARRRANGSSRRRGAGWRTKGKTVSQRSKEYAHDYRYFPEPDLPPLRLDRAYVESIRARLPELPDAKRERFARDYALSDYEANLLTETRARAEFFDACLAPAGDAPAETRQQRAKSVSNWMLGDFAHLLNDAGIDVDQAKIEPAALYDMIAMIEEGAISGKSAKTVFEVMFQTGKAPAAVVKELGLTQISGEEEIEAAIDRVLAANAKAVEDYRSGKAEAVKFLVGQIMKETRGRANPGVVNELLQKKLKA